MVSDIHRASLCEEVNDEEGVDPSPLARRIYCHPIAPLARSLEGETMELDFMVDLRI
jgi:hypothetical protein